MEAAAPLQAIPIPAHDSFFQAIADVLNVRDKRTEANKHTVQSLRNECHGYALDKNRDSFVFQAQTTKDPAIEKTDYLNQIKARLPGHEFREGRILAELHNFVLRVHWFQAGQPTGRGDLIAKNGVINKVNSEDVNKVLCINCTVNELDTRSFSAAAESITPQSQALPSMKGIGSDDLGPDVSLAPGKSEFSDEDEEEEEVTEEEEEEAQEEEEESVIDSNLLLPIAPSEKFQCRVIANPDEYRSELIQRQRWAISPGDPKQAKRDKQYVEGSIASYGNFLKAKRLASYAPGAVISIAYREKDVEQYEVKYSPSVTPDSTSKKDTRVNIKRTQIFNPIKYAQELDAKRTEFAKSEGPNSQNTQRIDQKLLKFQDFMTECAEQTKEDEKAEKFYDYNLYEYEDDQFEYETVPDGSFTARQIFVAAVFLFFSNLLFWSMWYQGAATFYQSLIEEKMDLAESIYCTFSAVYGKIRLLRILGGGVWDLVANSMFNFLSAPLAHAIEGALWFLRGEWAYSDLTNLLGFGATAGPVGAFFALLTPNATEGLITAITHKNLTHTAPFDTILEISTTPFIEKMSMYGSGLLNVMGTPGAFGFTQAIQSMVVARQIWVSRAGPTEMILLGGGLAAFAAFGWLGMGANFQLIGTKNFEHFLGIGNAAPILAIVPTTFIMMLFLTTSQTFIWKYGPMLRDIITRKFKWESLRDRNKQEFILPVQIILNGISFIVTLGFTTTGALTTLWQQKISGQVVTPFVRVAGVTVATTIEWDVMHSVSTDMVETSVMYAVATVRNAHYDCIERTRLPALSDDPEDDIAKPVKAFQTWVEKKALDQSTQGTQSAGRWSWLGCGRAQQRRARQIVEEQFRVINDNNNNNGDDAIPLMPVLPAGQAQQQPAEPTRARSCGCGIQ